MDGDSLLNTTGTASSGYSAASSHKTHKKKKLSVESTSKIDRTLHKNITYRHRPSTRVVVIKWVSTFVLGVLLLACVTESKLSILALSQRMNTGDNVQTEERSRIFVKLQLLLLIPNAVNLIRGIWSGAFRKDLPWPRKKSLFAGVFVSFLESLGLALFVFNIPGLVAKPYFVVQLMSCVFLVPLLYTLWTSYKHSAELLWKVFVTLALILELVGIGMIGYLIVQSESNSDIDAIKLITVPIALLCLSFAWLPWVQEYLLQTKTECDAHEEPVEDDMMESHFVESGAESINPNGSSSGYQQNISSSQRATRERNYGTSPKNYSENVSSKARATWKLTIFMSFWKIIFTIVLSLLIFNVKDINAFKNPQDISMSDYWNGWKWENVDHKETYYFISNLITSIVGYLCGYMACTACMQRLAFTVPLLLATPLSVILLYVSESCNWLLSMSEGLDPCTDNSDMKILEHVLPFVAVGLLMAAQALSSAWLILKKHTVVMLKEDQLFWVPMYNSPMLEQWIYLTRKNIDASEWNADKADKAKRSKVIICTTMYREADYEMRQLLESIQGINIAQNDGGRHFESHIFFDGAVKDRHPTEFVLQLVSLVESTLGVKAQECTKSLTPYGMTLTWTLKADPGKKGMIFRIHLKDNFKVKNKKRWSQVMYMSYVLDFLMDQMDHATDDDTYILTTDADVRFTPDSVEALLDLMTRDHRVGAVCARTHPLGSGPLVWYQVFEYAIGHWFQKAAEHVLGSVLCSPGCFSVYRCKAIRDIIPQYSSNVEHAFQFLTKDMGEDRWFCTLMVQSGWRIEYCAASENSTHCPEDFDEFFKQRRRWVASTLANLMLLIKEWHIIAKLNHRVSFVFLIYQTILLFATLIGPSSVILVISGGLQYAWKTGGVSSLIVQLIACVMFTFVCLTTSSKTQLNVAKFLTFAYAVVMTAVVVGTAVQIATDFDGSESAQGNFISDKIKVSTTTVYIATMASVFVTAGIMHLREIFFLMHGVWYLLCLPAGYLILMIYSICNITDRSWGTREVKTHSVLSKQLSWQDTVTNAFKNIFFCCYKRSDKKSVSVQTEHSKNRPSRSTSMTEGGTDSLGLMHDHNAPVAEDLNRSVGPDSELSSIAEEVSWRSYRASEFAKNDYDEDDNNIDSDTVTDVKDWLPQDMKKLAPNFIQHGFDNTMLISGMTEKELKDIGIKRKGMKKYLMEEIKKLPDYEIQAEVPENVHEWLNIVGLTQYESNFKKEKIESPKDMEVLKSFGRTEIEKELKITKSGHIKRLMYAIRRLRNPTESELRLMEVKKALMVPKSHRLKDINKDENEFWENLRSVCLLPQSTAFGLEDDLKAKLGGLRNSWLMIFAVSNALWLILIYTLAEQGQILAVFGSNPIGLVVLVLFGLVLIIQFLAMIVHRITTLAHFLGRAPYKSGETYNTTWAFKDSDIRTTNDDEDAERLKNVTVYKARHRLQNQKKRRVENGKGERMPLLGASNRHVEVV